MIPGSLDDLGRHGRCSRVTWYPGSTPPYSSLWITIQRFVMLNQPSRAAFAQDFLVRAVNAAKVPPTNSNPRHCLNDYRMATTQSPVRLTRFARVLRESAATFSCCHIGQFARLARPYFGEFVVCIDCLGEGFHSVLYAFQGIHACPVHGTQLERLSHHGATPSELFAHALRNPYASCQSLRQVLGLPAARWPKANASRDQALGEVAKWLMELGSRCWLGQHGAFQPVPLDVFTRRLCQLRTEMKLSDAIPGWADARLLRDPIPVEIATLGTVKVAPKSLVDIHDRRAARHQTDLSIFGHTLQGDFKAIRRHLQHRALNPRGRSWLARLARTKEPADIDALLKQGGTPARQA